MPVSEAPKGEPAGNWNPYTWKTRRAEQLTQYEDPQALDAALEKLSSLPPLVTSWEIERLKELLAEAQQGRRFILQGGDCAETLADCRPQVISNKLKILLQMSLVLVHAAHRPVTRIGRIAGQYAKPRSKPLETRADNGVERTLPSYFGDLINDANFDEQGRQADPERLVQAYQHAAMTINFVRSLTKGGFADLHHPEYWDLSFMEHASLPEKRRQEYLESSRSLSHALRFMEALGETSVTELTRVEFFTSHEGLNLHYEAAQTRQVPRREGFYNLTTHLPWIGERTRQTDGAHVEYFRGIRNPVGVKVGPTASGDDVVCLCEALNPRNEPGKIVLIARMGAENVASSLPPLIQAVKAKKQRVLWVSDPMHGNTETTRRGIKTRRVDSIFNEIERTFDVHEAEDSTLGGVHFELTGEDVTECIGGAGGVTEEDLETNYASPCDPRLNYRQSLEMAFRVAQRLSK